MSIVFDTFSDNPLLLEVEDLTDEELEFLGTIEALTELEARLSTEDRANPYHDGKTGKFASKNGGGGGSEYVPGAWKEAPKDSAALAPHATYVAKNGNATYAESQAVSPEKRAEILSTVDDLQTRFPTSSKVPPFIFVETMNKGLHGMTVRGNPVVMIDAAQSNGLHGTGDFMPSAPKGDGTRYTLAHEWGHVLDTRSDSEVTEHTDGMSVYGKTHAREGFAEAFADHYMTNGKSTNPATKAYAEEEGWQ